MIDHWPTTTTGEQRAELILATREEAIFTPFIVKRSTRKALVATLTFDCLHKDFLPLKDLGSIAYASKQYLTIAVQSTSRIWELVLAEQRLGFTNADQVSATLTGLLVSSQSLRPHGKWHDYTSYIVLFQRENLRRWVGRKHKINLMTSMLEDAFHLTSTAEAGIPSWLSVIPHMCVRSIYAYRMHCLMVVVMWVCIFDWRIDRAHCKKST